VSKPNRRRGSKSSSRENLQTVIVSKDVAKTRAAATKVARRFANRIYTSRETKTSWRFRQRPPTDFVAKSFKTFKVPGEEGVSLVYGKLKRKSGRTKNPVPRAHVRRWMRYRERAAEQASLAELGELAARGREIFDDERMRYLFELSVVDRANELGMRCGRDPDEVRECVDELIKGPQMTMFDSPEDNPKLKRVKIPKNPRGMPDPGPCAWLGSLLEWAWVEGAGRTGKGDQMLWEPDGTWAFLWSPRIKGVIGIPDPSTRHRMTKVSRSGGAAKLFERFTARPASNTYEISVPKVKLQKLGKAGHIVYRSDKWNPGEDVDYIHDFKEGVQLFVGPTLANPQVFLCFGGRLTCTERGLVY
jgi:hypothetical protein